MRKLTANDICKGSLSCGEKHCALGWIGTVSAGPLGSIALLDSLRHSAGVLYVADWNDSNPPEVVAEALNNVFQNPEMQCFMKGEHA